MVPISLRVKPFSTAGLAYPDPGNIPLPDVHDALSIVDEVMDLPFQDGLEIRLHLAAGHLDINPERQAGPFFHVFDVRAYESDLAVFDFIHLRHLDTARCTGSFHRPSRGKDPPCGPVPLQRPGHRPAGCPPWPRVTFRPRISMDLEGMSS